MATISQRTDCRRRAYTRVVIAALVAVAASQAWRMPAHAQTAEDASSRVHIVIGGFAGRLDLDGAGRTDLIGGRAGVGFGELGQLTGFYWRGVDRSEEAVTADHAWGGELQFNLNTGFGVAPFVVGGVARVDMDTRPAQTAAVVGAGLTLPLGPVLVHAGARDHMFGVGGLSDDDSPEDVTHNWLYSAGVTFALGRRRSRAVVAAAPPRAVTAELEEERAALDAAAAELRALRDSLAAAGALSPDMRERLAVIDTARAARSYHSAERIEVPIPTHGSITLRYGPETAATAPVVLTVPGAVAAAPAAQAPAAAAAATDPPAGATPRAAAPVPPAAQSAPLPAATLQDPANRAWLQQLIAAQVAQEMALRPVSGQAVSQAQLDVMTQRVLDGVVAAVVPQLDAAQAQRMNALRQDLRDALASQRTEVFGEIARLQSGAAVRPPATPAAPPPAAPPVTPAPQVAAAPPLVDTAPAPRPADDVATDLSVAAARATLADVAADHPMYLSAAETERGPAAVLGDGAFESGAALVVAPARRAVSAVAAVLRAHPDRRVYVHGHTDAVGAELQNQRLSELRAEAVRSLLVQEGVAADRVFAIGYGLARPVAGNETARGRALNRRVEIVIGESGSTAARD